MAVQLIYHTPTSMTGGPSPFDAAIMDMIEGQEVCIACPYLGVSYLQRIIERTSGWRLLTDVQEWLSSHSAESRMRVVDLILANSDRVRHCAGLHAKVLIAGSQALTGSANFTATGVTGRVEVSVLFEGGEQVDELLAWFDLLWGQTAVVSEADLRRCVVSLPPLLASTGVTKLPCSFPGVAATLSSDGAARDSVDAENRLIERLRLAPDRRWVESWLDLARELIEMTGLNDDDPRLVMSLPTAGHLPVTINRRYVLTAFRIDKGQHEKRYLMPDYTNPPGHAVIELILPASMKDRIDRLPRVIRHSSFDPGFSGESDSTVPHFVSFSMPSEFSFPPEVLEGWRAATLVECNHQRISNFRQFHEPVVYRAAVDLDYRRSLLDRAFGTPP